MNTDYDVIIVGGGLVGASLALALTPTQHRVALVESQPFNLNDEACYDERSLALGWASRQIYAGMGLWSEIEKYAVPIRDIHISERGRLGVTRLNAQREGVAALGYVVTLRELAQTLYARLKQSGVQMRVPATLENFSQQEDCVELQLQQNGETQSVTTRLLVASDGMYSPLRSQLGIDIDEHDYGQHGVIANVTPQIEHRNRAFERFTCDGPVALLPLSDNRCALVWTQSPEQAEQTLALSDEAFMSALRAHFGHRLGRFIKTGKRQAFPLKLIRAKQLIAHRSLLIGNAAHTMHPVAGQGLNLALRDVAVLADLLSRSQDAGADDCLNAYAALRQKDIDATAAYTDGLLRLFSNPLPLMNHFRGAGLALLDRLPPLKSQIARIGMGYRKSQNSPLFTGKPL